MQLKNKKVLVTGSEGFIGSHLVEQLVQQGAEVTAFVLYNSFNNWGWIDTLEPEIKKQIQIITGDVRDENSVRKAIQDREVVFHLAALIAIPYSYTAPGTYIDTNVKGTLNVLQACSDMGIERLIHTSTSEVYGTAQYVPIDEKHPLQGQSPYSASKVGGDMIAESFYRSFNCPVVTARPFNTYGPRQSARAVIPTIISQILSGITEIKLGSLTPTRDFNFVKDTANGFISLAQCDAAVGQVINIGTGKEITIGNLFSKIVELTGRNVSILTDDERLRPEKSEVNRLCADNTKISTLTSWKPQYSLDEGLKETIQWIESNLKYFKTDIYNI